MAELAFVVRFRGAKHALSLDASAPARELFAAVERATGVPAAGQKLIARGKKLALGEVGEAAVVGELVRNGDALMLSGATAVDAADLAAQQEAGRRDRVRGFADEARVQRRRLGLEAGDPNQVRAYSTARAGKGAATLSDLGSMGSPFGAVRELAAGAVHAAALAFRNGLVDGDGLDAAAAAARAAREAPPPSAARALLERVAADAGVVGIMRERGWRVGALTEMPPVGKVGVSSACLLGVNKNKGQEISLRLRTDDLRGFRTYDAIMRTMLHELTHMEISDHNNEFKELCSQLGRDYARLDWRGGTSARAVGGGGAAAAAPGWQDDILGGGAGAG